VVNTIEGASETSAATSPESRTLNPARRRASAYSSTNVTPPSTALMAKADRNTVVGSSVNR
jgi:hypothetical protein